MSSIDGITASDGHWKSGMDWLQDKGSVAQSSLKSSATSAPPEGIRVTLSGAGLNKEATENSDIEESGLPETIQTILKLIRELKEQIARRQAELQAVLSDKNLDAEQMQMKSGSLQTTIAGLNSGLMTAYARLNKAIKAAGLNAEQLMKVASLVAKF